MRELVWTGLLGALLAGCGGDVDLTGVYRVESSVGSSPCGTDTPVTTTPPYLKFEKMEFFGQDFFGYDGCTDEAGTDCSAIAGLFGGFYEPIDDGWRGVTSYSSGSGGRCSLGFATQTAILDGDRLVIEASNHQETVDLPEAQCSPDEAETRGVAMPCVDHALIEATPL